MISLTPFPEMMDGQTQAYIINAELSLQHGGNGENAVLSPQDGFGDRDHLRGFTAKFVVPL